MPFPVKVSACLVPVVSLMFSLTILQKETTTHHFRQSSYNAGVKGWRWRMKMLAVKSKESPQTLVCGINGFCSVGSDVCCKSLCISTVVVVEGPRESDGEKKNEMTL